jgi:hypothetical protein
VALNFVGSRQRRLTSRELDRLDVAGSERLMRDIGLAMSDMSALTRPNAGPTVLLSQRLGALGLDAGYLADAEPATLTDLQRSCLRCTYWRRCARDLARGDVQAGLDGYCLNSQAIDRLLLARHGRAD